MLEDYMFDKTINFSDLKKDPSLCSNLKDDEAIQIFHRGQKVKVMITQKHYLALMAKLALLQNKSQENNNNNNKEEILSQFESQINRFDKLINKQMEIKKQ